MAQVVPLDPGGMNHSWRAEASPDRHGVSRGNPKRMQEMVKEESTYQKAILVEGEGHATCPYFVILVLAGDSQ